MTTTGPHVLSYATAARSWTDALPPGNGRLGAMVYGPVPGQPGEPGEPGGPTESVRDRWQINDDTCWSGWPGSIRGVPASDEPSPAVVQRVREALLDGDVSTAEQEIRTVQYGHSQAYQPLAELEIQLPGSDLTLTQRRLELSTATASWTATSASGGTASSEVFARCPSPGDHRPVCVGGADRHPVGADRRARRLRTHQRPARPQPAAGLSTLPVPRRWPTRCRGCRCPNRARGTYPEWRDDLPEAEPTTGTSRTCTTCSPELRSTPTTRRTRRCWRRRPRPCGGDVEPFLLNGPMKLRWRFVATTANQTPAFGTSGTTPPRRTCPAAWTWSPSATAGSPRWFRSSTPI